MSFSKRSIPLSRTNRTSGVNRTTSQPLPGVKISPVTGLSTISTGCPSLDTLLAANAGLTLGQSLLIEEQGTTDYSNALLRCFAAEGVLQGQRVHVVGTGEAWGRELPGVVEDKGSNRSDKSISLAKSSAEAERMKIAWRYEHMGAHGERAPSAAAERAPTVAVASNAPHTEKDDGVFCHTFDFTKRLVPPVASQAINYIPLSHKPTSSPFDDTLLAIQHALTAPVSAPMVHRVIIPSLLSPASYPPHASMPESVLGFLQALRALLRQHPSHLSIVVSLPLTLYPRSTGLARWIEHLADGVIELAPFPHRVDFSLAAGPDVRDEEKPQGMVKVHALPIFSEKGGGAGSGIGSIGDDLCFLVSRRKFLIKPFNLPPVEGDTESQTGEATPSKASLEF